MGKKPRYVGTIEGLMNQIKTETDADKRDANKTSKTMNKDTKLYKPMGQGRKYKYAGTSSMQKLKSGSKKKMPKARDMAMGDKNIVYMGDPYMVDGKMFDPVKAHPENYLRPEGAKTYSEGGEITKGADYIKDLIK
jgi:hypothetical protein